MSIPPSPALPPCFLALGVFLPAVWLLAMPALAQQQNPYPVPRLATVMPAGGKAGTTVEVTVGGLDLEDISALYFSHPGIKAQRAGDAPKTEAPRSERPRNRQAMPGSVPAGKFKVTIPANTPVGLYDIRVVSK